MLGGFFEGAGDFFEGGLKSFLVVGHIPVETFLLISYFFDATHTSSRIFHKGCPHFRGGMRASKNADKCGQGDGGLVVSGHPFQ